VDLGSLEVIWRKDMSREQADIYDMEISRGLDAEWLHLHLGVVGFRSINRTSDINPT
jgi:hypothetical protein